MFSSKKIGILDPEGKYINPLTGDKYREQYFDKNEKWSSFPVYINGNAEKIIKTIKDNRVLVLESGTGSGKTVLVPKYCLHVLDYKGKVIVTVPKQILARSTAERDAKWLDVTLGDEVGYKYKGAHLSPEEAAVRGDITNMSPYTPDTKLTFATGGTLVQMLSNNDPELKAYDIVVIDEAHERSIDIDESLLYMRRALRMNPKLRLIVMSATLPNSQTFLDYFGEFKPAHEVFSAAPNKPVEIIYPHHGMAINLKKPDEVQAEILRIIDDEIIGMGNPGDILAFIDAPGAGVTMQRVVQQKHPDIFVAVLSAKTGDVEKSYATDKGKYQEYKKGRPRDGWSRRIIFSTNVAESSLTVEDLKYVIDSGSELKTYYNNEKQQDIMKNQFITQAQATQRKGRVGRDSPGVCFRLYTEQDYDNMQDRPDTTILDADMTSNYLKYLKSKENNGSVYKMVEFVEELMEHPSKENVLISLRNLYALSIITEVSRKGMLTSEGLLIAQISNAGKLPNINWGRAILFGRYYGCERTVVILSAIASNVTKGNQDLFYVRSYKFKDSVKNYHHPYGDLFSFFKVFIQFHNHRNRMDRKELESWAEGEAVNLYTLENILKTANETYKGLRYMLESIEIVDKPPVKEGDEVALFSLIKGFSLNIAKLNKSGKKPTYTNLYPSIKTTASFDSRGDSFFSLINPKKLPQYMFYMKNQLMNNNVTFQVCNVCPFEMIKLLTPEEKSFLDGIK